MKRAVNILLVDDNPAKLMGIEAALTPLRENLVKAGSGKEALRAVLSRDFAVILLDVNMPGMDGFETAALIRQRERSSLTPIIFVTAEASDAGNWRRGYELGAVEFIYTPVAPEILRHKVAVFAQLERQKQSLAESERRFRATFDESAVGMAHISLEQRWLEVNRALCTILGRAREDLMGEPCLDLVHPEDAAEVRAKMTALEAGAAASFSLEVRYRRADGSWVWVLQTRFLARDAAGAPDYFIAVNEDISARRNAEEELRQLNEHLEQRVRERTAELGLMAERLELSTRAGGLAIWDWDLVHNRIVWDDRMYEMFGVPREAVTNPYDTWLQILHPEDAVDGEAGLRKALDSGKDLALEFRIVRPDGAVRHIKATGQVLRDPLGKALRATGFSLDVTAQKQHEAALRAAVLAADDANRAKSVFLANMSHEIRTPLNAILGFSRLLAREPGLNPSQLNRLKTIGRAGEHLLELINDILDLSKIEAGRMQVVENPFSMRDFLDDLDALFTMRAEAKSLTFTIERNGVAQFVVADEKKLRQMLVNLLGNAVKFTGRGSVTLRVHTTPRNADHWLTAEVVDTGPGLSEAEMARLFTPFEQGAAGIEKGGTGLGLAITRQFANMLGGRVGVTSEVGRGSCFRVEVPLRMCDAAEPKEPRDRRRVVGLARGFGPYRILVVDDRPENRVLVVELLRAVGMETREGQDGFEALAQFEAWQPHAIFLDMRMPGMSGYEALRRMKATSQGKATAIIALTASAFDEHRHEALAAGADDFISKPFREGDIMDKLRRHLGVEFVYADEEAPEPAAGPVSLAGLPRRLRDGMGAAVLDGDRTQLDDLIRLAAQHDPAAAAHLSQLAATYQYELFARLLEEA